MVWFQSVQFFLSLTASGSATLGQMGHGRTINQYAYIPDIGSHPGFALSEQFSDCCSLFMCIADRDHTDERYFEPFLSVH